jgi:hypothetical protein
MMLLLLEINTHEIRKGQDSRIFNTQYNIRTPTDGLKMSDWSVYSRNNLGLLNPL